MTLKVSCNGQIQINTLLPVLDISMQFVNAFQLLTALLLCELQVQERQFLIAD